MKNVKAQKTKDNLKPNINKEIFCLPLRFLNVIYLNLITNSLNHRSYNRRCFNQPFK